MTIPCDAIGLSERLRYISLVMFSAHEKRVPMSVWEKDPPMIAEAATQLDALQARVKELEGQVYVPGSWCCPKCKFTLLQSNLNTRDGTVTSRDTPGDKCPNCNGSLWRCTWKQDAFEMQERAVEQMERAKAAESRATRAAQERDEALERAARVADATAQQSEKQIEQNNDYYKRTGHRDTGANDACRTHAIIARMIAAAIRRLASGPDKEKR